MAASLNLTDRWVLVTGASSGLGREIARVLARDYRAKLVLTARRRDRLEALAAELAADSNAECEIVVADLTDAAALDALLRGALHERTLHAAVINAGVTFYGPHDDASPETLDAMIATNVTAVTHLTTKLFAEFDARQTAGALLLVSSLAGEFGIPYQAAYSGTKGFVTRFGRALRTERRGRAASVTVFAPGGIATEMLDHSGLAKKFSRESIGVMPADRCADAAVLAMIKRRGFVVPGVLNKLGYIASRILPTALTQAVLRRTYRL